MFRVLVCLTAFVLVDIDAYLESLMNCSYHGRKYKNGDEWNGKTQRMNCTADGYKATSKVIACLTPEYKTIIKPGKSAIEVMVVSYMVSAPKMLLVSHIARIPQTALDGIVYKCIEQETGYWMMEKYDMTGKRL